MKKQQPKLPQRNPASPLQVVGWDGQPPVLGGISDLQRAGTPQIQDTTQNSYQAMENAIVQSRQSIDSISQTNAQVASAALQASARVPDVKGLIEPLMSGIQLWQESQAAQAEAVNSQLGAKFEQRIRDIGVQLAFDVEQQTTEEGYFTTRAAALQEAQRIAQEFREQGLSDEAITPILGIIQTAASTGIREDLTRYRQVAEDERNKAADQGFAAFRLQVGPLIGSLASARDQTQMDVYVNELYSQMDGFFQQYDINDPALRLQIQTMVVSEASEYALQNGQTNSLLVRRAQVLDEAVNAVNQATAEFNQHQDYGLYQMSLERIDAYYAQELGKGTVVGLASDPLEQLGYERQLGEFAQAEAEYQQERYRSMLESDPAASNARQQTAIGVALGAFNNDAQAMAILSNEDHALHTAVKAQYEAFTRDHNRFLEIEREWLEAREVMAKGAVEYNRILDDYDPTTRFGRLPTTITPEGIIGYQQALTEVLSTTNENGELITERGTVSAETVAALREYLTVANQVAESNYYREMQTLQTRWEPWGVDVSNPQNTSALQDRVSGAYDILQNIQEQNRANAASPPTPPFP